MFVLSTYRLVFWFATTVLVGIIATICVPSLLSAQPAESGTVVASHPRAVSAPPVTWTRAVATRALTRGDTLRADDFVLADTSIHGRVPYGLDTTTPAEGWVLHRAVAAGEWLRAPAVQPVSAVVAGRPVQAVWTDGDVTLSVAGIALNTAPVGAQVSVRVGRTRRLRGVVIAPDSVRIR